jgi:hypothetical protein
VTKFLVGSALVIGYLAWAAGDARAVTGSSRQPVALAVHVHSTISTGSLSLDQLAGQAKTAGLDGLLLTENYDLCVEYGLWPLRGLLRYGIDYPSVSMIGPATYLEEIRAVRSRHPELLWIPGLEVMPHYFWTGSLWRGDLTVHNTQKNLLVVGLDSPARMAAVEGGPSSSGGPARFWPVLMAVPAVWLWRKERVVEGRTRFFHQTTRRRYRAEAACLALIGALLLTNNLILARHAFDPYGTDPGDAPAQRLINAVRSAGGMSFWSLPEAVDVHRYLMSDLAAKGGALGLIGRLLDWYGEPIAVRTDPYPESLAATTGYTGFGAIYEDNVKVTRPGGEWDRLLEAYLDGRRAEPVWGIGELAYHETAEHKRLSDIQTVVLAESRSVAAVLSALRAGAFYARRRQPAWGLALDDWSVHHGKSDQPITTTESIQAISGQTLRTASGTPVIVHLAVSASDGRSTPVMVNVIRSGRLWRTFTAVTPFEQRWYDNAPPAGGRAYYRVEAGKGDQHLLSNPLFVSSAVVRSRVMRLQQDGTDALIPAATRGE